MKKIRFLTILFIALTLIGFYSCDKKPDEIKLNGTTWVGDCDFIFEVYDDGYYKYDFNGTITIDFTEDKADVVAKFKMIDPDYPIPENLTFKGTGTYTRENDNITVRVSWKTDEPYVYGDEGKWTGTIDNTTMILRNVFGETVRFKK